MRPQYQINKNEIENVVLHVSGHVDSLKKDQKNWKQLSEQKLWEEMVSCILGSRTNFEIAFFYASMLSAKKLIDIEGIIDDPFFAEEAIKQLLESPLFVSSKYGKYMKYPFYHSRSEYIVRTALNIYKNENTTLKNILSKCNSEFEAREILHELVIGMGYKQTSLFLRNIGYSHNLAILDTHVLKYMTYMELLSDFSKSDISNKRKYIRTEKILNKYAISWNKNISRLDIAIWVVMRLLEKEYSYGNCNFGVGRY
jgi:N-glycosylase/DNA lyase